MGPGRHMLRQAAAGAAAGLLATWSMGKLTTLLYERENTAARQREDQARGGRTAYEAAAEKIMGLAGRTSDADARKRLGSTIHWVMGATAGAVYGIARRRFPALGSGHGLLFGTAFWAVMDEAAIPALGLTPGPAAFPWQTHMRGLAGHLAFGAVAHSSLDASDRLLHGRLQVGR